MAGNSENTPIATPQSNAPGSPIAQKIKPPIVPWSYAASNFYYNLFWYPLIGRGRVKAAKNTEWGKLFDRKREAGVWVFDRTKIRGELAESYEVSPDGLKITFKNEMTKETHDLTHPGGIPEFLTRLVTEEQKPAVTEAAFTLAATALLAKSSQCRPIPLGAFLKH